MIDQMAMRSRMLVRYPPTKSGRSTATIRARSQPAAFGEMIFFTASRPPCRTALSDGTEA